MGAARVSTSNGDDEQANSVRRFVDRVASQYGVKSVLEGPVRGPDSEPGSCSRLLSARGISVTVGVSSSDEEPRVRARYAAAALVAPEIRCIRDPLASDVLPHADMVVSFGAAPYVGDWAAYVTALARAAQRVLVMIVQNSDRALSGTPHPSCQPYPLARLLWGVGRVKEHAYLAVPSWAGWLRRAKGHGLVNGDAVPSPGGLSVRLTAPLRAFVVDTAPRTRQARRRLELAAAPKG
jgi:hypothetical protein